MSGFPVSEFLVFFALALVGAAAILPYSFDLAARVLAQAKRPRSMLALLNFLQTAVLVALSLSLGLLAARRFGLNSPYFLAALEGGPLANPIPSLLAPAMDVAAPLRAHGLA